MPSRQLTRSPGGPGPLRGSPKTEPVRRQLKVAFFDDCPEVVQRYSEILRSAGYMMVTSAPVESADEAMALFRAERPDVVITDLCLTDHGTEGFAILDMIRQESGHTPVALCSSVYRPTATDRLNMMMRRKGFDALFQKADFRGILEFVESRF